MLGRWSQAVEGGAGRTEAMTDKWRCKKKKIGRWS